MSADWKDRIEGIKRIVLALGVMSLCIVMSLRHQQEAAPKDPGQVETANAGYEKCSESARESLSGVFGCAVVLKPKVKASSIRFLSADRKDEGAHGKSRPMFHSPNKK